VDPIFVAAIYAVAGVVLIPVGFAVFKTQYQFLDVVLAALAGGAASLIPTVGGIASYAAMVVVLYWRVGQSLFPDIIISVQSCCCCSAQGERRVVRVP
jgi:hypothetical protein